MLFELETDALLQSLDPNTYERVYICDLCSNVTTEPICQTCQFSSKEPDFVVPLNEDFENFIKPAVVTPSTTVKPKRMRLQSEDEDGKFKIVEIHKKNRSENNEGFICPECGIKSDKESCTQNHDISISQSLLKINNDEIYLKKMNPQKRDKSESDGFICPECGIKSNKETCSENHSFSVPQNMCDICNLTFESIADWMNHMKKHNQTLSSILFCNPNVAFLITPVNLNELSSEENSYLCTSTTMDPSNYIANMVKQETLEESHVIKSNEASTENDSTLPTSTTDDVYCNESTNLPVSGISDNMFHIFDNLEEIQQLPDNIIEQSKNLNQTTSNSVSSPVYENSSVYLARVADILIRDEDVTKTSLPENRVYPRCDECEENFEDIESLCSHFLNNNNHEKAYIKCQFCTRRYTKPYWFRCHLQNHTNLLPIVCPFCDASFLTRRIYEEHLKTVHSLSGFDIDAMIESMSSNQTNHIMCMKCGKWIKSEKHYDLHMKAHNLAKAKKNGDTLPAKTIAPKNKSNQLPKKPKNKTTAAVPHLRENVTAKNLQLVTQKNVSLAKKESQDPIHIFECNVCSTTIKSIEEVREHLSNHARSRLFKCEACSERFPTTLLLQQHDCKNRQNGGRSDKRRLQTRCTDSTGSYVCNKCPLKFNQLNDFLLHRAIDH
ncbi:zinc finger protein 236-like [Uranotaenia lowii]|uniref:zinc finger protein 236-like n=1 Tax=Uranotaenia lowii TaxID=190385 RepID=UPI002479244E|nr:zinc finger protein 236-like [Uranotaenia lowii]